MTVTNPASPTIAQSDGKSYYHTREVAVIYPLLQSLITGASLGILSAVLAWLAGWYRPLAIALMIGCLAQAITWLVTLGRWHHWVYKLEEITGLDIDGNGDVGQPPAKTERIELIEKAGQSVKFIELPASKDQLIQLGAGLLAGTPFAEANWTGRLSPFSKAEFRALRNEMLKRGLLRWINPGARAQGLQLTSPGWAIMRHYALLGVKPPTLLDNNSGQD